MHFVFFFKWMIFLKNVLDDLTFLKSSKNACFVFDLFDECDFTVLHNLVEVDILFLCLLRRQPLNCLISKAVSSSRLVKDLLYSIDGSTCTAVCGVSYLVLPMQHSAILVHFLFILATEWNAFLKINCEKENGVYVCVIEEVEFKSEIEKYITFCLFYLILNYMRVYHVWFITITQYDSLDIFHHPRSWERLRVTKLILFLPLPLEGIW